MKGFGGSDESHEGGGAEFTVEALAAALPQRWIEDAVRESGGPSRRRRKLPAAVTAWMVVLLSFFRRLSYVNLLGMLHELGPRGSPWPQSGPPCSSALTRARDRLGVAPLRALFERVAHVPADGDAPGVAGRRVLALDGTTLKMPDTAANRRHYGFPVSYRGRSAFPQLRMVALVDTHTRRVRAFRHGPYRSGELELAHALIPRVPSRSLVILDRRFCAYAFLRDLVAASGADVLVRVPASYHVRRVRRLGPGDSLIEVRASSEVRKSRPDLPRAWLLREIVYRPRGGTEEIRLFTTLLDPAQASRVDLARLYHLRWEEETVVDEIKTHLADRATVNRAVVFRSTNPGRVEQELYALLVAYDLLRALLATAARGAQADPIRLSFVGALERIREAIRDMRIFATARLPERYQRLLGSIARQKVPIRPGRQNPRVVRIKMSNYPLKRVDAA